MSIQIGDTFEGSIIVTSRGTGYLNIEKDKSMEIQNEVINKAFDGDNVKVRVISLNGGRNGEIQGEVIEILRRKKTHFVGTTKSENGKTLLIPDSQRMYIDFQLENPSENLTDNTKIYFEFIGWNDNEIYPKAKTIKTLGQKGVHEVEMQSIILEQGFESDHPEEVKNEAEAFLPKWEKVLAEEIPLRKDMRGTTTFTIDPVDAKDFDDALSIKKLPNGNLEIGIHIADVSYFVRPDSNLDKEAFERSFSVYLVDRTIPMLPEALSNNLCSLKPDVERLAFSAIFEISPDAEVLSEWYGKTIIKSDRRFTYEEAQAILNNHSGDFYNELETLNNISKKLGEKKMNAGAIRFERDEFEFELDEKGVPLAIHKKEHIETHSLIEEFMLLANKKVAKYIHDTDKKLNGGKLGHLMYRVHSLPDPEKLQELSDFIGIMGYKLELKKDGSVSPSQLNQLLDSVKGKPESDLISSATVKTMSKALYSTLNEGHFGLAFEYYTHFTSPIRRYPDLIVHRIMEHLLKGEKVSEKEMVHFKKSAEHSSEQEVNAQEAERQSIKYKQVEFMMNHIGEEFDGIISGVTKFGLFVLLKDSGAAGMVHISKLGNDYFVYDQKNYCIKGERSGKKFSLGDQLRVKIVEANLDEKQLQMELVEKKTDDKKASSK